MKKIEIEIKGHRMVGAVAQSGTTTWYSLNGEVWTVEAEERSNRAGAKSGVVDPAIIVAPMPGKIIKVMVALGAAVQPGETLIVMEAMKMEYTLKAAAAGTVEQINCQIGQQVSLGATLVRLKLSKEV